VANERFIIRPELMSLFFICLYIHILYKYQKKNTRLIYLLPFLQIIWANMHGLAVMGIGLIGLFLAGELFAWICPLPFKWKEGKQTEEKIVAGFSLSAPWRHWLVWLIPLAPG